MNTLLLGRDREEMLPCDNIHPIPTAATVTLYSIFRLGDELLINNVESISTHLD